MSGVFSEKTFKLVLIGLLGIASVVMFQNFSILDPSLESDILQRLNQPESVVQETTGRDWADRPIKVSLLSRGGIATGLKVEDYTGQVKIVRPTISKRGAGAVASFVDIAGIVDWDYLYSSDAHGVGAGKRLVPALLVRSLGKIEFTSSLVEVKINGQWVSTKGMSWDQVRSQFWPEVPLRLGQFETTVPQYFSSTDDSQDQEGLVFSTGERIWNFGSRKDVYAKLVGSLPGVDIGSPSVKRGFVGQPGSSLVVNGVVYDKAENPSPNGTIEHVATGLTRGNLFSLHQPDLDPSGIAVLATADSIGYSGERWRGYFTRVDGTLYTFTYDSSSAEKFSRPELIASNIEPMSLDRANVQFQASASPAPVITVMSTIGQFYYIDKQQYGVLRPSIVLDPSKFEMPKARFYFDGSRWQASVCSVNRDRTFYCAGVATYDGWEYVNTRTYVYSVASVKLTYFPGATLLGGNMCGTIVGCDGTAFTSYDNKNLSSIFNYTTQYASTHMTSRTTLIRRSSNPVRLVTPSLTDGAPYPLLSSTAIAAANATSSTESTPTASTVPVVTPIPTPVPTPVPTATPLPTPAPTPVPAAGCSFNGVIVASGASVTAYASYSVPSYSSCQSEIRYCNAGTLSGSYSASSCVVSSPEPTSTYERYFDDYR